MVICTGNSTTLTASGGVSYSWSSGQSGVSISVTPASTTTYTVTATNINGCVGTASATVTANPCINCTMSNPLVTTTCSSPYCSGGPSGDYFLLVTFSNSGGSVNGVDVYVGGVLMADNVPYSGLATTTVCINNATFIANGQTNLQVVVTDAGLSPPTPLTPLNPSCTGCMSGTSGLIINEVSNGLVGSQEWFELLVVGNGALNANGWVINDNNGIGYNNTSVSPGYMFFNLSADPSCSVLTSIPSGSLIVIYNGNSGGRDSAIPTDDPFDSNGDGVYIIPSNHLCMGYCSNEAIPCASPGSSTVSSLYFLYGLK
ncbi:MAG: hypothetical protein IPG85_18315 [Bacteroidetes bacterium]|nr:hypothetical protein [Bacteroidota bacterium]